MFKFLIAIFISAGLFIILLGLLGIRILRTLFGFNRKSKPDSDGTNSRTHSAHTEKDKIFGEYEGEYVEFEEIDGNDDGNGEKY